MVMSRFSDNPNSAIRLGIMGKAALWNSYIKARENICINAPKIFEGSAVNPRARISRIVPISILVIEKCGDFPSCITISSDLSRFSGGDHSFWNKPKSSLGLSIF